MGTKKTFITMEVSEEDALKRVIASQKYSLIETTKKLLRAILELPRFKIDYNYNPIYDSDKMETIEELRSLEGDVILQSVLEIFEKESGLTKEDFEEFLEEYRKNLKGF